MQADPWTHPLAERLTAAFPGLAALTYLDQPFVEAGADGLHALLQHLKDREGFNFLVDLTAVDYPKRDLRFELVYLVYSFESNLRLRVKTRVGENDPADSVTGLFPGANWPEREVYDMFGVVFRGHPDLKRILLPDEWKGHPLRKDMDILAMDNDWVKANLGIESGQ